MKTFLSIFAIISSFISFSQSEINTTEKSEATILNKAMEVLIAPNPAVDKCTVIGEEGASCKVYSATGTYIGTWNFDNSNTVLLTDLPSGILQAVIEKDGVRVVKRIVVL